MKRTIFIILLLVICFVAGCQDNNNEDNSMNTPTIETTPTAEPTMTPTTTPTATPSPTTTPIPDLKFSTSLPGFFTGIRADEAGTLVEIEYPTYDYYGDKSPLTKPAFVYLPHGYDETKQYNVLYLMHGIGGNEREWGMTSNASKVKCIMDNLIAEGIIEPFIVVTPNGRSGADYANTNADFNTFYSFGQELRNDLIPYIEANFATYAEYSADGYDMAATRDHRAMAGLSMGGMQTINIGMCECLDIISYFGAFSAAPTSYASSKIGDILAKAFADENIHYLYSLCGTEDQIAYSSASGALKLLPIYTNKVVDGENFTWQEIPGVHDFRVWYLGFFNFAQLVFQ